MRSEATAARLILMGAALCGLIAVPAQAQYFGQNKVQYRQYGFQSITSDHFEVFYYPEIDSLARRVLDLAEKTNLVLTDRLGHRLGRRVPIILYGSHNDFAQTNITPELIDAGTGGFTELLRNRVVLPFTGSYEEFRHVVVHELVHAYMFDLLYGGSAASLIARQSFFQVPLWFAEGMAEYVALGIEPNAEMFLRDGTIHHYLPPLMYSGGYLVYKQGQSAISYLVDRYGEDRLRDLLKRIRTMRNFERAFQRAIGTSVERFDQQWREELKRRYWPLVATQDDPERFAKRLTDHRRDESHLNTLPAISPQGDRIAYFSDRRQYTDVYVMSAFDGKVQGRVIRGERGVQFEAIPSFRSSIAWSADGSLLGLTAKSAGRDVLYLVDSRNGKVRRRIDLGCDALAYPAWSPVSDSLVVVGLKAGRSDLWVVDGTTGAFARLTDDAHDDKEPTWSPDGRTVTFTSDRLAPVVLQPTRSEQGFGATAIFDLDLATGVIRQLIDAHGDDRSPAWSPDGRKLAFVSERGGTPNIFLYDQNDGSVIQLTDVQGGITSLSWSRHDDRLVFSAFNRGGWDIFAVKEPLSKDSVLTRLRRQAPQTVVSVQGARAALEDTMRFRPSRGALALAWPESLSLAEDTLGVRPREPEPVVEGGGSVDTLRAGFEHPLEPPAWTGGFDRRLPAAVDSLRAPLPDTSPVVEHGGPFAISDSVLSQEPTPYRVRLAPDYAGAGFYASNLGVIGASQIALSDFLGNHNVFISTGVFSSSLSETNALVIYNYLPRRWDLGLGLFHFKDYFASRFTTLGEQLGTPRLFSERTFGLLASTAYPFDRFRRAEVGFTQMFVERQFFDEDPFGGLVEGAREYRSVSFPSLSLIGDNTLYGSYGPVNGGRYNVTFSPALPLFDNALSFRTVTLDARRYWDLSHGYTFASRALGGFSDGRDPQVFRVGGFSTLRGYPDFDIDGSRIGLVNAELRFPFIRQLGLVGPLPLGVFNLRGALFTDAGVVWSEGESPRLTHVVDGQRRLRDLRLGFGTGARTAFYFFILKLDVAWNTDLHQVSKPRWHFSIGPEF